MDPQQSPHTSSEHQKVQLVAQQLLKAINEPGTQTDSNIIIFLTKLYKNNSPIKNKKMKSIRLSRFIQLLECIAFDFPQQKDDIEIMYHCLVSTLLNDKNFYDEEDYELVHSMGVQIARVVEKLCEGEYGFWAVKLLTYLINNEPLTPSMEINTFEEKLKLSTYYPAINLDNRPAQVQAQHEIYILEQPSISNVILDNLSIQKAYSQLFKSSQNKSSIINLFYQHLQKLSQPPSKSRKQLFLECFISQNDKLTIHEAEAVLKILENKGFDRQTISQVVNKITQDKLSLEQLFQIDFKKIKGIQQVFVQCLLQQTSKRSITEVIHLFLSMKSDNNYFPLYLILKLNKKIPSDYIRLFFQDSQIFNVRRAIVFVLAIIDNEEDSFNLLLKTFIQWNQIEKIRTKRNYQCILKAIHFSLQNITKTHIISQILRYIHKQNLNQESCLQFLSYNTLKVSTHEETKHLLTEENRNGLSILFKTLGEFDKMTKGKNSSNPEEMKELEMEHKCRLDLEFLVNSNPFVEQEIMSAVKELNKLLDGQVTVDQLVKQLPSLKESLWEVSIMWINNKFETFYTEEVNNQAIEWALKTYKRLSTELNTQLKTLLEKEKLDKYFKLIKTLIEYGIEKQSQLKISTENTKIFTSKIKQLINSSNSRSERLNSNNFNDYFLTQSQWKYYITSEEKSIDKTYKKITWLKSILIELKDLIKNMIKAEKTPTKKELKNIVAENVADVLAFKVIHEYFDSEIQDQSKDVLVEIFRHIQPDTDFFERTEALASSLSIEFYSIFEEIPNLLQNLNSDTLIFLSKLITSPKPAQEETKKKKTNNKKKNQKQVNVPEDNICINTIVKHFNLLFSDPNSMESHKSLFIILRRLFQLGKIDKNQLCSNMNRWLLEINFISCSGFEPWKNKVLSLSKMWKNAADIFILLSDKKDEKKFEIKVLEKHFNLFTDLLNKLYENFRDQPEFLELQQRILLSLCLIYKKQDFSDQIEPEKDMTDFILKKFQQRNISRIVLDNKFYYCHECKKNACYACSSFLHRNHDKTYTGKIGTCEHENVKVKKDAILKIDNTNLIFGSGIAEMLKKNEDLPEQLLERISQKLLLSEQFKATEEGDYLGRYHSPNIQQILQGKNLKSKLERSEEIKRKLRENQNQLRNEMNRQDKSINEADDEKSISPEAEDYFQYKEPYCKEFKKIHSQLNPVIPKIYIPQSKINVSPLAKVFLRELQNQHFHYQEQALNSEPLTKAQNLSVQEIKQKYLFFRNNNLKGENRDYPYGRGRGGYGGFAYGSNPRNDLFSRRNILACNKKNLFIPSSLSMTNLSMTKLRQRLEKKIENKEYSTQEQEKNYLATPPVNLPFDVVQTSLSQSSTCPTLAVISTNQLCFYSINADGRFGRQINTEFHRVDNILKFTWINEKKNLFAIAYNNYIRVGGVSPSNSIKTFAKAQIGKSIRDFDGYMNSKTYMLFIVDTEGKLYFVEVDFKEGKNAAYSPGDRLINLVDENGKQLPSEIYSIKNIDSNKILLSCENGTIRTAEINRESNIWKVKTFDLRKTMKSDQPIVLEAIKIVKEDEQAIVVSAISRKFKPFENRSQRRCQGSLVLIKLHENIAASSILFTREENIESYDFTFATPNTLSFIYANEEGAISMFKHNIESEASQVVEKITPNMDNHSIKAFCKKMISNNMFYQVEDGAMLKNLQFKQNKQLTGNFTVNLKQKQQISIKELYPSCTHFVTGIVFEIQLPPSVSEYICQENNSKQLDCIAVVKLKCLDSTYKFFCNSKKRQIQIPLNIKETIELFCHENEMKITYSVEINQEIIQKEKFTPKQLEQFIKIKTVHIHGFEARDLSTNSLNLESASVYHKAFKELYDDWFTYQEYQKEGFQEYLLNIYRMDFHNVDMKRLYKLKYDNSNQGNGFKMNEINLFLKLELFSQTISQSLANEKTTTKEEIEEYLNCIKKELLSEEYKRKSLQNSVYRLCQAVCHTYQTKSAVTVGHPYHKQTLINLHHFITVYKKWLQKKNIFTFDQLCTLLSNLILSQAIDLQLILQACPELIVELSINFRKLITDRKHKQYSEEESQVSITRICSKYIAILCEYYQVLKNRKIEKTEEKLLFLLEQVFGHAKSDMPKELIMNPFLYLESILNLNEFTEINSSIDLYNTQSQTDFSQIFFDFDKAQKQNKKASKKETSSNLIKQEEQQLLNENNSNSNYEAIIEEEKDMEEEQKDMYMEIEEDFDDEEDEIILDEVEQMELELGKERSSLKEINNTKQLNEQLSSSQKNLNDTITKTLLAQTLPKLKKLTISHYDFPLELAIALFRKENFLTSSNIYFYLGLLYNLLKIIENNLKIRQNKAKIMEFVQIVDRRVENVEYSSLFIVLNFFLSPKYSKGSSGTIIKKPQSSLSEYFSNFYLKNLPRFHYLLTTYNPTIFSPLIKLSEIMRFTSFEMKNELYNLKLISNVYLSFRLFGNNFNKADEKNQIKQELLFKLVKYKIPVLKNIMLYEKWENELDRAKILVSYEILRDDKKKSEQKEEGINMLYKCAKQTPERFIQELLIDETKVSFLQQFTLLSQNISEKIQKEVFELLEIYYNS